MESTGNWIVDILNYTLSFWSDALRTIWDVLTTSPQNFRGGTVWRVMSGIQGGLKGIAYALLVLFFLVGVVRTTTNFAEIKRPEVALKLFIRFAVAKAVVTYSMDLMTGVYRIVQGILTSISSHVGSFITDGARVPDAIQQKIMECSFLDSMKKSIILLIILALLILAAPFVIGKLANTPIEEPIPEVTPEPTEEPTPEPTIEVVEIRIPAPDESCTPKPTASATPDFWPVFPVIDEPVTEPPTQHPPSGAVTPVPQVTVPKGAAFVLTIRGKNITIAKKIDEATLEQSPGWLDSSAKPGKEGVCVVYGHRNRNHFQVLKDVDYGDSILVTMSDGKTYTYIIESTEILETDEDLRIPTIEGKHLMLTTCYPFYYSGHAPKKYVVIATLI